MDLTPSAVLPLPGTTPDFDYGAFLQDEDADYMADDPGYSASTMSDSSAPKPSPPTDALNALARHGAQKQRLERRGHTKSRRGCFNCKRRRIKVLATRHHRSRNSYLLALLR